MCKAGVWQAQMLEQLQMLNLAMQNVWMNERAGELSRGLFSDWAVLAGLKMLSCLLLSIEAPAQGKVGNLEAGETCIDGGGALSSP